jgi:hypothetical protein
VKGATVCFSDPFLLDIAESNRMHHSLLDRIELAEGQDVESGRTATLHHGGCKPQVIKAVVAEKEQRLHFFA